MGKLTALDVKRLGPGKHGDGDCLYLIVSDTGSRKWVLIVQANGKRINRGLGSVKEVTLSEAREAAYEMRRAFRRGETPVAPHRQVKNTAHTFREVALMVHEEHSRAWRSGRHGTQWLASMERHVFPKLGKQPIDQIDAAIVRDILAEIWLVVPDTARRIRQRIGLVLDYAHSKQWRTLAAPMRIASAALPKQTKAKNHHPSLPWQHVPNFISNMDEVLGSGENVRLGIELIILTAARTGEVRQMCWNEIVFESQCWTVPASKMKTGIEHRVPLSACAMEILGKMKEFKRTDNLSSPVFEGSRRGQPLSQMTFPTAIRRAGLPITLHGFRASFRNWCSEANGTPREIAEACLSHSVRNQTEAAYATTDHLERRRGVMDAWALYCTGADARDNVTPIRQELA